MRLCKKIFDYVIITVSTGYQKNILNKEIELRKRENIIPLDTTYIVMKEKEKIGSGGAIFNIIKFFAKDKNFFNKNKVLLINSAGDSKRMILYADKGKVCTPTFNQITKNISSILFDDIMIEAEKIGEKIDEGMLIVSGDCVTLYDSFPNKKIENNTAISVKAEVEVGERHGVFIEEEGKLKETLQKKTIDELKTKKAIDKDNNINIDTGIIYFNSETIRDIKKIISTDNEIDEVKFNKIVNRNVKLNFYTEFIYPLSKDANEEEYLEQKGELDLNENLLYARKELWNILKNRDIDILNIKAGKFIHFGTVREFIEQAFNERQEKNIVINSKISKGVKLAEKNYIENSIIKGKCNIGENSIIIDSVISGCDIPSNVIVKTVKNKNAYITIIIGIDDDINEIWDYKIYTKCYNKKDSVESALKLYNNIKKSNYKNYVETTKFSIREILMNR